MFNGSGKDRKFNDDPNAAIHHKLVLISYFKAINNVLVYPPLVRVVDILDYPCPFISLSVSPSIHLILATNLLLFFFLLFDRTSPYLVLFLGMI